MNPRLFEGPEENDFPRGSGGEHRGKDPGSVENPKRGSLQRSLPLCSPPLSFSGAGRPDSWFSNLKATPTPQVPISRNRGVGSRLQAPKQERREP